MAEGYLHESKNKTMEEVGDDYFFALVSRSLFQQLSGNTSLFTMHDLVNDLATFVSGKFNVRTESDYSGENASKVRHLSYVRKGFDGFKKFEALYKAKKLCTFLPMDLSRSYLFYLTKKVPHELLAMLKCLRVLSLSLYDNMTELPESIGKLKHLRYLDLFFTKVQRLPDSLCQLCNLQTLRLSNCKELVVLPRDRWKLISLRHLDITETSIKEMPIHLGRLKCLQTLTKFIVSKGSGSRIRELRKLVDLWGSLAILDLQNIESPNDALNASLKDKKHLEELVLEWNVETHVPESQKIVLDGLRPHTNLKSLIIKYYGGKSLSDWIGLPSFSKLASLILENCNYCSSLPSLGQLPSLQELYIVGFDELVTVGHEFCGSGSSSFKPFGALKVLSFRDMKKWEKWISIGDENEGVSFPQLENLSITKCPKLTGGLPTHLPSLAMLEICKCPQLVASLSRMPAIRDFCVQDCKEVLFDELLAGMQTVNIGGIESLPKEMIDSNGSLQELSLNGCSSLMFLPKDGLPSTLKTLSIYDCGSLVSLPEGMIDSNGGLQKLVISGCSSLVSLPEGMIDSNSGLQELVISGCSSLVSLPKDGLPSTLKTLWIIDCMKLELSTNLDYSSLGELWLSNCDSLKSFSLDLFPNLYHIKIYKCSNLESFPKGGLRAPNLTLFWVFDCGSLRSLPDKMHILLPSLQNMEIRNCPQVESFPEGGLPSNLKSIEIRGCEKLIASRMGWGLQNLPCLRSLSIKSNSEDVESFPEELLLPTSLTSLGIWNFPNLKSLDKKGLQHLNALEKLWILNCPKLNCMPEQGLPPSLSLSIIDCPLLRKKLQSKKGKEWRKIAHVQRIEIDYKWIE